MAIGLGVDDATAGAASVDGLVPVADWSDDGEIPQPASVISPPSARTEYRAKRLPIIAEWEGCDGWSIMTV
jgi:hypothetical protein